MLAILLIILLVLIGIGVWLWFTQEDDQDKSDKIDTFYNSYYSGDTPSPPIGNYIDDNYHYARAYNNILRNPVRANHHMQNIIDYIISDRDVFTLPETEHPGTVISYAFEVLPDDDMIIDRIRMAENIIHNEYANTVSQDEYYDPDIPNDTENVHDSNVQQTLVDKYNRMKLLNKADHMDSLLDVLYARDIPETDKDKIVHVVRNILINPSFITNLNAYEYDVVAVVWNRIHDNSNLDNLDELRSSFFQALRDCYDDSRDRLYCITGRVSRILDSLTLLDTDPVISEATKTQNILRKEIMNKTYVLLQEEISKLHQEEQDLYAALDDSEARDRVVDKLKATIRSQLTKDYIDQIHDHQLSELINEAVMGVDMQ